MSCKHGMRDYQAVALAVVAYAGPFDDPRIGWTGTDASSPDLFKCERCGVENLDSSKIEHKEGCSAAALLAVLKTIQHLAATGAEKQHCIEESILKSAYWDFDARVKGYPPYTTPCGQPEHAFVIAVQQTVLAATDHIPGAKMVDFKGE